MTLNNTEGNRDRLARYLWLAGRARHAGYYAAARLALRLARSLRMYGEVVL